MHDEKIIEILKKSGAFLEGHFLLTSGKHSNRYIEKIKLEQNPTYVKIIMSELKKRVKDLDFDYIVSPALGAIVLGYELAREMDKQFVFTQRKDGVMTIRSGFELKKNAKVLIVEDIVTTGGSIMEVIECLLHADADIQGIGIIVDRSNGKVKFDYATRYLLRMDIATYLPEECPMCKKEVELVKPGASGKKLLNK